MSTDFLIRDGDLPGDEGDGALHILSAADTGAQFYRSSPRLKRQLSLLDGISVVVGIIMGSGIFTSPGVVLVDAGSVGLGMLAWVAAGAIALCFTLIYAELGSSIPVAGGDVHYYKLAFGNVVPFVYVWSMFFVLSTGSLAIVTLTFAQYLLAGMTPWSEAIKEMDPAFFVKTTAIISVTTLTFCNCLGVEVGSWIQNLFSLCKGSLVAFLLGSAAVFLMRDTTMAQSNLRNPFSGSVFSMFGPAMVAAVFAFCGWGDIVFLAEEMKDPVRDLPLAAIAGISIIAGTYFLVNISYLCVLPASAVMSSSVVAVDMTVSAFGSGAGAATAMLVAFSILGSANGITLVGGRYLYAAGRDGHIFSWFGCLGRKRKAPVAAMIAQGVWCLVLLVQSNSLVQLLSYFGTASFLFSGLTAVASIKLRRDFPDLCRPFTVPCYPFPQLLVICTCLYLVLSSLIAYPRPTSLAFAFILSGFPVHLICASLRKA